MSELKVPSFAKGILEAVLSPPVTLSKLAAQGMFASIPLNIPPDVQNADLKIQYEGVLTKRSVLEVYAPGDETGWAIVYKEAVDGFHSGEVELIWGKWELFRGETDYSRTSQNAKWEAEAGLALDLSKGVIKEDSLVKFKATPGEKIMVKKQITEDSLGEIAEASGPDVDDADSHIEEDMYKEYFRGEGYL